MAFKKYNIKNNAICALNLPLSDTDVTMVLKGNYDRFPTSNFIVKITKKVSGVVTARENIYVTTRSGATCTGLTRAYEPVPISDSASTQIQQALSFAVDDVVENVPSAEFFKDIQDAVAGKLGSSSLRSSLITNSNKSALLFAGRSKLPIINGDFSLGSGTTNSGWIGQKSYGWYNGGGGYYDASYDSGRLKLTSTYAPGGGFVECRNTDGGYFGITAESLPVEPNTTYTLEYDMETQYISGDANGGAKIVILCSDVNGNAGTQGGPAYVKTTTASNHYSYTFTTNSTDKYLNISPIIYAHTGSANLRMNAWFDNITIICTSQEILKEITPKTTISANDKILIEQQSGDFAEVAFSNFSGATDPTKKLLFSAEAMSAGDICVIETKDQSPNTASTAIPLTVTTNQSGSNYTQSGYFIFIPKVSGFMNSLTCNGVQYFGVAAGGSWNATITDVATSTIIETLGGRGNNTPVLNFSGNTYLTKGRQYRIDFPMNSITVSSQSSPTNNFFTWGGVGGSFWYSSMTISLTGGGEVGRVTKRLAFSQFGSGLSTNYIALSLKKTGTPLDFVVRIETDNAGSPSGTLVDPSATLTYPVASIGTTYGVGVAMTFPASFSIPFGQKVWIVCSQVSDTVNTNSYYTLAGSSYYTNAQKQKHYAGRAYLSAQNLRMYVSSNLFVHEFVSKALAGLVANLDYPFWSCLASTAISEGSNGYFQVDGVIASTLGLPIGMSWYLDTGTPGLITSSNTGVPIGYTLWNNMLLIRNRGNS